MKKIILLIMLLLLPAVFAGNENGKITAGVDLWITDLDIKVDGLSSRNLEYSDDISRIAKPGSVIEISVEITNNNSNLAMEEVDILFRIEDFDLEEVTSQFDLSKSQDKRVSQSFTLPDDAEEDTYQIFIEAEGELNNSIHRVEYEVTLEIEVEDVVIQKQIQSQYTTTNLDDLNATIGELKKDIGSYFNPYSECDSERAELKEKLKGKDTEIATFADYKSKYEISNTQLLAGKDEIRILSLANQSCVYDTINIHIPQIQKTKNNYTAVIVALIVIFGLWVKFKDKLLKPDSEAEETDPDNK